MLITCTALAQAPADETFEYSTGDTVYTMKKYVFCLYLNGNNRDQQKDEVAAIQRKHLAHLSSLQATHGLMISGPLDGEGEKRGILIFDLKDIRDAESAMASDPAVVAGRLTYECHYWWAAQGSRLN